MKVIRALLSSDAVTAHIRQAYSLAEPIQAQLLATGDNDSYLIESAGWRGVCRVYSLRLQPGFSHDERRCELAWLLHLAERGVRVSTPVPRRDGALLGRLDAPEGMRDLALFTWAEGESAAFSNLEGMERFGQRLAELHLASMRFQTRLPRMAIDRKRLVDTPLERITGLLQELRLEPELARLQALAEPIRRRLDSFPSDEASHGFIHGDCNGENHHLTPDGQVVFFDMDLSGPGWFAYDPAVLLWTMRRAGVPAPDIVESGARCIAGYQRVRPLASWELEALDDLVLARHFWVMGEHIVDIPSLGALRVGPSYWRLAITRILEWQQTPLVPLIRERLSREGAP
ncbi:phosphotransferase [Myxococcus xanthus DK 1622]|uniref:Phosphotransferase n=1 Tax=Myxococcus xanthus (strain DK1622) TaxID=246197 RepID=Q1DCS6_MYXXD|nr:MULTISPECIES: phosphotransferase [Myxococcus]ABF89224.1 phosphotransferase [Myxococcus xanthus DK 1622]NOJ56426.1 phosphotransferase [Myxococcus xanthus]QPM80931.1 phosphotransferase [Myxococcus xanthus]QVW69991.1 phosphotransferase [Myxococcus xanthus DZ2]QZZ48820.1 Homoserine kinase [Myxococcus xanthus]